MNRRINMLCSVNLLKLWTKCLIPRLQFISAEKALANVFNHSHLQDTSKIMKQPLSQNNISTSHYNWNHTLLQAWHAHCISMFAFALFAAFAPKPVWLGTCDEDLHGSHQPVQFSKREVWHGHRSPNENRQFNMDSFRSFSGFGPVQRQSSLIAESPKIRIHILNTRNYHLKPYMLHFFSGRIL